MRDLAESINEGMDAREVKRAVSVKMGRQGLSSAQICQVLNVSPQYVSKWKGRDEVEGAASLRLGYGGSEEREGPEWGAQRAEIAQWSAGQEWCHQLKHAGG